MKTRFDIRNEAITLRKQGFTYKEIMQKLPVKKGTLSGWLSLIPLSKSEEKLLLKKVEQNKISGRMRASLTNRNRRIARDTIVHNQAVLEFEKYKNEAFFLVGIALYWAEGAKRDSQFSIINSDPGIIMVMKNWAKRYLPTVAKGLKYRLYIHQPYKHENCELFWSQHIGIPEKIFEKTIYKPTPHLTKKNPDYKGCLRMHGGSISDLRKMITWQKRLKEYYVKA